MTSNLGAEQHFRLRDLLRYDLKTVRAYGNRNELLALEQATVDRELIELVTGPSWSEEAVEYFERRGEFSG